VIITCASKEVLNSVVKPLLVEFLKERGLVMNINKTKVVNIKEGYKFLGFWFKA
jgi:RNA-directed DNA polymerase